MKHTALLLEMKYEHDLSFESITDIIEREDENINLVKLMYDEESEIKDRYLKIVKSKPDSRFVIFLAREVIGIKPEGEPT